jgi:hypothetical protein
VRPDISGAVDDDDVVLSPTCSRIPRRILANGRGGRHHTTEEDRSDDSDSPMISMVSDVKDRLEQIDECPGRLGGEQEE